MKEKVLTDIGLSKNESKSYLALLELGASTSGQIAERARLHRSNAYDAIERLYKKGLVATTYRGKAKYFEATNPKNLINVLKAKEQRLEQIMPQLQLLRELAFAQSEATIYEGASAFMDILYNFLDYNETIVAYGIPRLAPEMLKTMIPHFHKKRLPKKIQMRHIYNHNAQERIAYLNTLPHTSAKYLPAKFDSQVSTTICGNEVVLSVWITSPLTIRIKDKRIAEAYKKYFDLLWKSART
jgi:HTH-type transcriptional regulator, sugar sensing transcriptional regulator